MIETDLRIYKIKSLHLKMMAIGSLGFIRHQLFLVGDLKHNCLIMFNASSNSTLARFQFPSLTDTKVISLGNLPNMALTEVLLTGKLELGQTKALPSELFILSSQDGVFILNVNEETLMQPLSLCSPCTGILVEKLSGKHSYSIIANDLQEVEGKFKRRIHEVSLDIKSQS